MCVCVCVCVCVRVCLQGRRNVFSFGGGGGGGKDKKGHNNVKKGTNGAHADNITNVLMKHHCRHKVSFDMLRHILF